jgi:uncharacterized tellurite resistance protein B-like protein
MFLSELNETEKLAFLELATLMVSIDGKITVEESDMLQDAAEEMEINGYPAGPIDIQDLEEVCLRIEDTEAKAFILLELASFAFVDHDYDESEKALLRTIAKKWKLDKMSMLQIEEWAFKRVNLAKEAAEIVRDVSSFSD